MKKIILLFALAFGMALSANALTYEEAFEAIKNMPEVKGVEGTEISGDNDFTAIGITDGQLVVWDGERGSQTGIYGNTIYKIMGELPASEMVQCRMNDSGLFAIFAKPISQDYNRIIIFSDSPYAGFTGTIIGYINNDFLNLLRSAVLLPREGGGTSLYLKALNF